MVFIPLSLEKLRSSIDGEKNVDRITLNVAK
jgi:hypothetical protein